jgi:hypothetical protein
MTKTFHWLVFMPLLLIGCGRPHGQDAPTNSVAVVSPARTVETFRFIGPTTTVAEVNARLGQPERDAGSGMFIFAYRLTDGSEVLVGSPDGSRILYVRHGKDVLFERK